MRCLCVGIRADCIYNLSNSNLQLTTLRTCTLKFVTVSHYNYTSTKYDTYKSWQLSQMFSGCKIMVVTPCFLMQADVTPSSVVTNTDPGCKIMYGSSVVVLYN